MLFNNKEYIEEFTRSHCKNLIHHGINTLVEGHWGQANDEHKQDKYFQNLNNLYDILKKRVCKHHYTPKTAKRVKDLSNLSVGVKIKLAENKDTYTPVPPGSIKLQRVYSGKLAGFEPLPAAECTIRAQNPDPEGSTIIPGGSTIIVCKGTVFIYNNAKPIEWGWNILFNVSPPLPPTAKTTMQGLLDNYFKSETLEGEVWVDAANQGLGMVNAEKGTKLIYNCLPTYLVLTIKRFGSTGGGGAGGGGVYAVKKRTEKVENSEEVTIKGKWCVKLKKKDGADVPPVITAGNIELEGWDKYAEPYEEDCVDTRYRLRSIAYHLSLNPNSGHYVSTVELNNKWYYCNDQSVSEGYNTLDELINSLSAGDSLIHYGFEKSNFLLVYERIDAADATVSDYVCKLSQRLHFFSNKFADNINFDPPVPNLTPRTDLVKPSGFLNSPGNACYAISALQAVISPLVHKGILELNNQEVLKAEKIIGNVEKFKYVKEDYSTGFPLADATLPQITKAIIDKYKEKAANSITLVPDIKLNKEFVKYFADLPPKLEPGGPVPQPFKKLYTIEGNNSHELVLWVNNKPAATFWSGITCSLYAEDILGRKTYYGFVPYLGMLHAPPAATPAGTPAGKTKPKKFSAVIKGVKGFTTFHQVVDATSVECKDAAGKIITGNWYEMKGCTHEYGDVDILYPKLSNTTNMCNKY